jgi:predicted nucleic acid-binding protein
VIPWAVIDTSVYIGHWEHGLYGETLENVRRAFIVRHSAVVLSELRRGARTRAAERMVAKLHALARDPWTPSQNDWWEAGRLIRTIGDTHDWDRSKRRDFQNDALIALTARRHGAAVVTSNRQDFELLGRRLRVRILAV